jgi:hypothetical protein
MYAKIILYHMCIYIGSLQCMWFWCMATNYCIFFLLEIYPCLLHCLSNKILIICFWNLFRFYYYFPNYKNAFLRLLIGSRGLNFASYLMEVWNFMCPCFGIAQVIVFLNFKMCHCDVNKFFTHVYLLTPVL